MNRKVKFLRRIVFFGTAGLLAVGLLSCGHHPWHHGNRSAFVLKHLDSQMGKLALNDSQKAAYQKLRAELESDLNRMTSERKDSRSKIKAELSAANPDIKKVAGYVKDGMKKHPDVFEKNIDRFADFYGQLNETQQKEVREILLKHLERFDG